MKKILAVLLSMLVLFSTCAVAFATEAAPEETTTEAVENENDLVFPENMTQLKLSVVFKAFEKFFSFIINLFGDYAADFDNDLAELVKDIFGPAEDTAAAVA